MEEVKVPGLGISCASVFATEFPGSQVDRTVPEQDFFRRVGAFYAPPANFFPIPKGVKFYSFAGGYGRVVVELPPRKRTIYWTEKNDRDVTRRNLAFPYVVLVLSFYHGAFASARPCRIFYRREPLKSWSDTLCSTNLLNVPVDNYEICLGVFPHEMEESQTWEGRIERIVRYIFWSKFTNSMRNTSQFEDIVRRKLDARLSSVDAWERASMENPKFVLGIPWPETGATVWSEVRRVIAQGGRATEVNALNIFEQLAGERRTHAAG